MTTRPLTALVATAAALAGGAALASARDDNPSKPPERLVAPGPAFFMPGALPPFLPEGDLADQLAQELDLPVDRVRDALNTISERQQERMEARFDDMPLRPVLERCRKNKRRCPAVPPLPAVPWP